MGSIPLLRESNASSQSVAIGRVGNKRYSIIKISSRKIITVVGLPTFQYNT